VEKLPTILPDMTSRPDVQMLRPTGTDDARAVGVLAHCLALSERPFECSVGADRLSEEQGQLPNFQPALKKRRYCLRIVSPGGVAERPIAPVLKTGLGNTSEGSNPSPSAPYFTLQLAEIPCQR